MRPAQANDEQLTQQLATALAAGDQSTVCLLYTSDAADE